MFAWPVFIYQHVHYYFCLAPECPKEEIPGSGLKDQQVLGVWGYCQLFQQSVETLRSQLQEKGEGAELVWDKVTHKPKHKGSSSRLS